MAINVRLSPPELKNDEELIETIIYIYKDKGLSNPIYQETFAKPDDMLNCTLDYELTEGLEYYITARYVLEPGGYQRESDYVKIIPSNSKDSMVYLYPPKNNPPIDPILEDRIYPPGGFTLPPIDLSKIRDEIIGVTVVIEDLDGNVRFISPYNNRTFKRVLVDALLPPDDVYILRISIQYLYYNSTLLSSELLQVGGFIDGDFYFEDISGCKGKRPRIITSSPDDFIENSVKIYDIATDRVISEFLTDEEIDLTGVDSESKNYYIEVIAKLGDGSTKGPIYHYVNLTDVKVLPYCLPYSLG